MESEFIAVGEKYFGNKSEKYLQVVPYPSLNINKNTLIDSSRMHTGNKRDYNVKVWYSYNEPRPVISTNSSHSKTNSEIFNFALSLINTQCHWQITEHTTAFSTSHLVYYDGSGREFINTSFRSSYKDLIKVEIVLPHDGPGAIVRKPLSINTYTRWGFTSGNSHNVQTIYDTNRWKPA